ncbi:glucan phosphoethanolaminetransferase (alkaline phosphatase superfamily) [Streptomyces aurantiacus]|uniref:hypothetical protein n=1 Tax=Streptomyces aurantiacus TaxID=47760 RepID=UPI0027936D58|nr:hypothetical protein [Streptomyces aurantiacus]MDQ0776346.1 glucan phosphoethanolaminetransferase (alkaline phosphatase superfamily) [Streptomyces aurantiacus]
MTTTSKTSKKVNELQAKIIISGVLLTFGWALVLAVTNWLTTFPCVISPNACTEGGDLAMMILFAPIFIGSILIPVGLVYKQQTSRVIKFFIVLAMAFTLYFIAYYLIVFAGISFHGLRG